MSPSSVDLWLVTLVFVLMIPIELVLDLVVDLVVG